MLRQPFPPPFFLPKLTLRQPVFAMKRKVLSCLTGSIAPRSVTVRQITTIHGSRPRMRNLPNAIIAAAMVAGSMSAAPAASAADLVAGVYASDPGACGHPNVLARISSRFDHQLRNVPNLPNVKIEGFHRIGETRYLAARENRPVERRYCHARVDLSNGKQRSMWYLLENPWGFAGVGTNVEFCIAGFDRWNVYNSNCRVLR
jgi:hypothetical protein